MASDDTLNAIDGLALPRTTSRPTSTRSERKTAEETELVERLQRASGHLIGFIRTGLYKRLSSCGHSYVVSLKRHLARNDMWLYAIENDLDLPVGTVLDAMFTAPRRTQRGRRGRRHLGNGKADYEALRSATPPNVTWVRPGLFTKSLAADLQPTPTRSVAFWSPTASGAPTVDSKLGALIELVTTTTLDEKVLVFTEYKDTADYVATALKDCGVDKVALVTGDTDDPTETVRRFRTGLNRKPNDPSELSLGEEAQHRVLIATDVLSEGQNLQDAASSSTTTSRGRSSG